MLKNWAGQRQHEKQLDSIQPSEIAVPVAPDRNYYRQRWIAIFWLLAIMLGAIQVLDTSARQAMDPDGVVYFDIGDAYFRGDWSVAINGLWLPLY
jgi:hypothetical protein